ALRRRTLAAHVHPVVARFARTTGYPTSLLWRRWREVNKSATRLKKRGPAFPPGLSLRLLIEELEQEACRDLEAARRVEARRRRSRLQVSDVTDQTCVVAGRAEFRITQSDRIRPGLIVISDLMVHDVEPVHHELHIDSADRAEALRVVEIRLVVRRGTAASSRFREAVGVALRGGEAAVRLIRLNLPRLAGLIEEVGAGGGVPRQRIGAVELQDVAAVAAQVAVLVVPHVAAGGVTDVRGAD